MEPGVEPDVVHGERSFLPLLAIAAMTLIWGSTFVVIKDAVEGLAVGSFLALRFAIAAAVLLALRPRAVARLDGAGVRLAMALGALYGLGQVLQTWGLRFTSPSISGFVTALYVVFTPLIMAAILRRPVGRLAWVSVAIATVGVAVLSLRGLSIGPGEGLTMLAALVYAAHIVALGDWSRGRDAVGLTIVQLLVVTAVAVGAMPLDGVVELPSTGREWFAVLYTGIAAGSLVLLLQTWAQARIEPTRAAVVMMLEPVFAAGFAIALGVDDLTLRIVIGGFLVLLATYLVELGPRRGADAAAPHPGPP